MIKFFVFIVFILNYVKLSSSIFDPCTGRSSLGGACNQQGDCDGFGLTCSSGTCQCHPNYKQKTDPDTKVSSCEKLPDTINAPCSGTCTSPMFCTANKCQCVRSKVDGKRCYAITAVGDTCTKDADCATPFSYCSGSRCACVQGTTQSGSSCVGNQQCPTGARPQGTCIRKSESILVIQNNVNSGGKMDNCQSGSYCYGPEGSVYGFCCPQTCPFNSAPDPAYSCDPTATSTSCPDATHYCHRAAGQSYSSTVCCRRPCTGNTPLYVKGQCYPNAFLGSPCQVNEQCDGGYGMQCSGGICKCTSGFVQYSDSYTTGENPPQICVRDCGSKVAHSGECFSSSSLDSTCAVNEQCPSGAACFRGSCFCDCRKGYIRSGSGCVKGQQTPKPASAGSGTKPAGGGLLGGGTGTGGILDIFKANGNNNEFLKLINKIFGGGGK